MVNTKSSSRRSFLARIWIGLGVAALLQFLAGAVFFIVSGRKRTDENTPQLIASGSIADFAPGSVTLIAKGHLYLTRLDDGGFLAISRKCTHLGCAVPWMAERKQFECPCHSSVFDMTGNVIKAPAPRALDLYSISFERSMVMIDISRAIKRSTFTAQQPAYPQELG
ncbi:MAG: ubiquinol-cytochrome c reductase iron-sulfur subunit [Deltaproteobacteria bacterium]|nr:ubiquinol-cytochrome c reductase iron-sulfur subunit [Deltaproteobacteria bacterium]